MLTGAAAQLAAGSVAGGLLAAAVIYLLSWKSGLSGLRLIVIGIAVNAMLTALNSWIVLRAELDVALAATGWSAGSLNGVDWDEVSSRFAVLPCCSCCWLALAHAMHQACSATSSPAPPASPERLRPLVVLVGVGCTATVTAVAGPDRVRRAGRPPDRPPARRRGRASRSSPPR